jgi:histidinol-phosphate/aromatic aminotransferase/cobyric acid decarboxylase-like protein
MAKKNKDGAVRLNVSVPLDLYEEMQRKIPHLNWSAVAAAAFRRALGDGGLAEVDEQLDRIECELAELREQVRLARSGRSIE